MLPRLVKRLSSFTGNNLDLAITGEGYLRVIRPDGSYALPVPKFCAGCRGNIVTGKWLGLDFSVDWREDIELSTLEITARRGNFMPAPRKTELPGKENYSPARMVLTGRAVSLYRLPNPQGLFHIGKTFCYLQRPAAALEGKAGDGRLWRDQTGFPGRSQCRCWPADGHAQNHGEAKGPCRLPPGHAVSADESGPMTLNVQA